MGSATIRRFAFVVAILLLAPAWCQSSVVARAVGTPGRALVGLTPGGAGTVPAIRRQLPGDWWAAGARLGPVRTLATLGVLALMSVLRLVPWATLAAARSALSSLGRRRHVISLRAPPPAVCA